MKKIFLNLLRKEFSVMDVGVLIISVHLPFVAGLMFLVTGLAAVSFLQSKFSKPESVGGSDV